MSQPQTGGREEFEAHLKALGYLPRDFNRKLIGPYHYAVVEHDWQLWLASRAVALASTGDERSPVAPATTAAARRIAAEQAEDDGLWFIAETASEAYLQAALRRLTAAVEGEAQR